ncbi:hypothetical protein M2451_003598 [Dysgonomonas sp. PFB1-18]|uniref:hypothetical protein n=1 Tax=unclassified Dysgonomonas TaxID=2630389 RepID=UPI00247537AF|nr:MULTISPECIES: hypothetical protein [unclassified Dysgonomonas]MDH6310786.1 hypothetical protein [Dysgonomonas sp. PF1-14]MDH6340636.1 hypothetical protein [Dysgonomonas sp. PF1-16]MDH6382257.1 hypothetical protein [Dysgonomonas sp. PFB1-18]MDH6399606.1 hypothetical protein [Dysgonomonas sp. PF1-23]
MKHIALLLLILLFSLSCSSESRREKAVELWTERIEEQVKPYAELKKEALEKRDTFRVAYDKYKDDKDKQEQILNEAQDYLLTISDDFFRSWYNTPWTFHGHSQTPREGSIACGYFVTTTLRDMGFNIPRIKWAQQASEYLIKKVSTDIKRFQRKPMKDVIGYIEAKGEGLYIVGLDMHVGYIYYIDGKMTFVHANYYRPKVGVMSEPLVGQNPLNDSKYRVIGKIFDKEMVRNWILNVEYSE